MLFNNYGTYLLAIVSVIPLKYVCYVGYDGYVDLFIIFCNVFVVLNICL